MKEKIYCVLCKKEKWSKVNIIELQPNEYKIIGRCPKCKTALIKIIKESPQVL